MVISKISLIIWRYLYYIECIHLVRGENSTNTILVYDLKWYIIICCILWSKSYLILSSSFQHIILNNKSPIKLFFELAIIAICPFFKNDIFFLLRFKITAQILQFANTKVLWSRCAEIVHVSVWMDFKEETVQSSTQVVVKFQNSSYFNSQGLNIF